MFQTEHRVTQSEVAERYFTCRNCGARGEVVFHAKGDSGWHREGMFESDGAMRATAAAEDELMKDAERVLHLIRCPTCGQRDGGFLRWVVIRVAAWFVLAIVTYIVAGEFIAVIEDVPVWLFPGIFVALGFVQAWVERSRLVRADRAVILRLQPGKRPEEKPVPPLKPMKPPTPKLPVAIAVNVPPLEAPEPVVQRGPDEEPAFLRKKD